ncbi:MAG: zf-HC2 domain-containing protein, partial [Acidimicrobiia bacterium]
MCREVFKLATDYLEEAMLEPLRSLLEAHFEECEGCV